MNSTPDRSRGSSDFGRLQAAEAAHSIGERTHSRLWFRKSRGPFLLAAMAVLATTLAAAGPYDAEPYAPRTAGGQTGRRFVGVNKPFATPRSGYRRGASRPQTASRNRSVIQTAHKTESAETPRGEKKGPKANVRLMFFNATWDNILQDVAEASDSELVMNRTPPGRFSRYDRRKYTRTQAVRILNEELAKDGFRLIEKGKYIDVMFLRNARSEYHRRQLPRRREPRTFQPDPRFQHAKFPRYERRVTPIATRPNRPQNAREMTAAIRQAGHTMLPRLNATDDRDAKPVVRVVGTRNYKASDIARAIYKPLLHRSRLVDRGPQGLPAFDVLLNSKSDAFTRRHDENARVLFTIGIDDRRSELVVQAPPKQNRAVVRMIRYLDGVELARDEVVKVIPTQSHPTPIVDTLQPKLILLAQNAQPGKQPKLPEQKQPIGGALNIIRGRVTIRDVPGVGLVITGNKEDVEAVLRIIKELDEQGKLTTPNVELQVLQHVNSQALAELLTAVYTQLNTVRTGQTQQVGTVAFIPVVHPNALLIISSKIALPAVQKLIRDLDRPVDPEKEYQVFHLKSAVASQIVTNLDALFQQAAAAGGAQANAAAALRGLATRVRIIADVRTNSVIVEAAPNDMKVVANLIYKLDTETLKSVSRVRIFRLKNAVATELSELINNAIQSVINPPAFTAQGAGGIGAGGQSSQQLRDAKSSILEFMAASEGDRKRLVRSGILTDIRVNPDPRTNALIVTAPEVSMKLIEALITQLDQPSALVAEIKVFTLANGDATAMLNLLQALFPSQQAGQTQQGQLGIQVVGAEDASSGLIPLRFSVDPRTNSIIAVGGAGAMQVVEAVIYRLDESDIRRRQTTVIKLRNSPVTEVSTAINQFLQSQQQLAQIDPTLVTNMQRLEQEIIVVPETVTNSLLISATPRYFDEIQKIVQTLDRAPAQVVIQALIVEVELNNTDEFGVELGFQDPLMFGRGLRDVLQTLETTSQNASGISTTSQQVVAETRQPGFNFVGAPLGVNTAENPGKVGTQGFSNLNLGRVNGELGFGGLVLSAQSSSVSVLLRALAAKRTVQVLSRPHITALDNQLAEINVGQEVPTLTGVTAGTGTTPATAQPGQPRNVGVILNVTPRIRPDNTVVMETRAESSSIAAQRIPIFADVNSGNVVEQPVFNQAQILTTVAVPSGQTIVLGGLITKSDETLARKVPWLGDVPLLKYAFRYDSTRTRRTELLIFLTPRIIRDDADMELVKQVEAERLHFIEKDAEAMHGPLYSTPAPQDAMPKPMTQPPAPHKTSSTRYFFDDDDTPTTDVTGELRPAAFESSYNVRRIGGASSPMPRTVNRAYERRVR